MKKDTKLIFTGTLIYIGLFIIGLFLFASYFWVSARYPQFDSIIRTLSFVYYSILFVRIIWGYYKRRKSE